MLVRLRDLVKHVAIHQRIIRAMIEQQAVLPDLLCTWSNRTSKIIGLDSI